MDTRKKSNNTFPLHALLRSIILGGFICLLTWLSMTEQLPLYINPKFTLLIDLSSFLLIPMFAIQVLDCLISTTTSLPQHCHTKIGPWCYIPFLIILILAFSLPANTLNANLVGNRGLNSQLAISVASAQDIPRPLASELKPLTLIPITDVNYTEVMSEINTFPADYLGKKVTMTGFVFRSPALTTNQLSLVRYVIMCCTSDTLPYGVLCETPDAKKYPDGTWLSIEGIIQMSTYEDKKVATIKITGAKQIKEPKNPYIFPYS